MNAARLTSVEEPAPTPLQLAILRAKVLGRTDATVARAFKLGERTVRRHLDHLIQALKVSGRNGLFAEAARRGWLDQSSDEGLPSGTARLR